MFLSVDVYEAGMTSASRTSRHIRLRSSRADLETRGSGEELTFTDAMDSGID